LQEQAGALGIQGLPDDYFVPQDCEVWPKHWQALELFLLCQDQWRIGGDSYIGLDLGVLLQVADAYDVRNKRQLVEDVQVIARRAAELLNAERRKD